MKKMSASLRKTYLSRQTRSERNINTMIVAENLYDMNVSSVQKGMEVTKWLSGT